MSYTVLNSIYSKLLFSIVKSPFSSCSHFFLYKEAGCQHNPDKFELTILVAFSCWSWYITILPPLVFIICKAPWAKRFTIRITAIVVIAESKIWILLWGTGVGVGVLLRPFLTYLAAPAHGYVATIVVAVRFIIALNI